MFGKKRIDGIFAKKIVLSQKHHTIEVAIKSNNFIGKFAVPREDEEPNFIDPDRAIKIIRSKLNSELIGKNPLDISSIDNFIHWFDGTENMRRVGLNSSIGVSIANLILASRIKNLEPYELLSEYFQKERKIPKLLTTIVEGQNYGHFPFKEIFLVSDVQKIRSIQEIFEYFRREIKKRYGISYIFPGKLGGYVVNIKDPIDIMLILSNIIEEIDPEIDIGIYMNAENYYFEGDYELFKRMSLGEYLDYLRDFFKTFKRIRIAIDPLHKRDIMNVIEIKKGRHGLKVFTREINWGSRFDGIATYVYSYGTITGLAKNIKEGEVILLDNEYTTCNTIIVDISVGLGIDYLRIGGLLGFERVTKYNRLLEITEKFKSP